MASVVLIGSRGSGKTTVGRLIAGRLGLTFVDTDALVVELAGMTIREIFESRGETAFYDLESAALRRALDVPNTVIATGGGIVLREENRRLLRASGRPVVYLDASPELVLDRIRNDCDRPLSRPLPAPSGDTIHDIRRALQQRDLLYREVATLVVDAGNEPAEIAEEIVGRAESEERRAETTDH